MAVYAIGDIQGCYDPFRRLLDEIRFDPATDRLWLTGDLVNRGPKSLKTLRFVKSLGSSAITVLGNHDLHLLALAEGRISGAQRFATLQKTLRAADLDELIDWLRYRPLAHFDKSMNSLLVHAGTHPDWTAKQTVALAKEVQAVLQSDKYPTLLSKMYGNTPTTWSNEHGGYKRLRFIINCLTRMRMLTANGRLNFSHAGSAYLSTSRKLRPWFAHDNRAAEDTRIIFGHWSALGLIVLPNLISLDTGCVWGRQLTAVRIDKKIPRVVQVPGQVR
jgi:bis(5'-nucleosyl)-tetraphosphatase (symmetrical)